MVLKEDYQCQEQTENNFACEMIFNFDTHKCIEVLRLFVNIILGSLQYVCIIVTFALFTYLVYAMVPFDYKHIVIHSMEALQL